MKYIIGITRVSTQEQGKTKNGLEAQAEAIRMFCHYNGYKLLEIVEEVVSGALGFDERSKFAAAVARAAKSKDTYIVVNKLDRLSRDAEFILGFVRRNPRFIVTELGENVDPFTLHIYAGLAEKERLMISGRTKAGLQAKKARGEALGATQDVLERANAKSTVAVKNIADGFAAHMQATVQRMVMAGMSYRAMADELNRMGVETARGGKWYPTTIKNLVDRFETA